MVYVNLYGRIGNNLFQIATAASLAHLHNTNYVANVTNAWCPEPDNCNLYDYLQQYKSSILRKVDLEQIEVSYFTEFKEKNARYALIPYQDKIVLNGYFQSEKYFVASVVRDLFAIDANTFNYIKAKYKHILFADNDVTAINVRRGDYLKNPQYYSICSMPYFNNAMDYIGRDKKYLVISDDIDWCRKHFIGDNFYFVEGEEPIVDLYLQSLCTNNIISNSSFSWWGAWLNGNSTKIVVAPKQWFGKYHQQLSTVDLIPENWIQVDNPLELKYKLRVLKIQLIDFLVGIKRSIRKKISR